MKAFRVFLVMTAGLAASATAMAHRLDSESQPEGKGFRIEFFTGDGSPASDLVVTARREGGEPIEIGKTDEKGIVHFVPPAPGEWTIIGTGAGGHSTIRNPLVIRTGESGASAGEGFAKPQAAPTASVPAPARGSRGQFPWRETGISLAFIAALTTITLAMMRRSARVAGRPTEVDRLNHEVDHLRATIHELRQEIAELKADRESRP